MWWLEPSLGTQTPRKNGRGVWVPRLARAHPESDSATDAGTNRCPQGVPKMSQIRSEGSGNVLHNANHLTVSELMPLFFLGFLWPTCSESQTSLS